MSQLMAPDHHPEHSSSVVRATEFRLAKAAALIVGVIALLVIVYKICAVIFAGEVLQGGPIMTIVELVVAVAALLAFVPLLCAICFAHVSVHLGALRESRSAWLTIVALAGAYFFVLGLVLDVMLSLATYWIQGAEASSPWLIHLFYVLP
jgi:hypothetical protein